MRKFLLLLNSAFIFFIMQTNAQQHRNCATWDKFKELEQTNPKEFAKMSDLHQKTFTNAERNNLIEERAIINIPVVVHVVYRTTAENISQARIQSQIDVLNTDYAGLNADSTNIPSAFKSLFGKSEIRFCLAQRDPSGNATTGILRVQTTQTSFSTNDGVKSASTGGSDAWDRSKYLNLWVCNLGGGVLGYAQFPGGTAATDGVVIGYPYFGVTSGQYGLGRTASHEVGHWLGLYHIWGDDGTACTGSDNVGDTPNQAGPNYGCVSFPHVTCSNGPNGDMFMNYMDYGDDACLVMFSAGQVAVMTNVLNGSRAALKTSNGCLPLSLLSLDATLESITTLNNTTCGTTIQPVVVFKNVGQNAITTAVIAYSVDGGTPVSFNYNGSLASLASTTLTLPVSSNLAAGNHNVVVSITSINGISDSNNATVNLQAQAFIINSAVGQVIAAEGFEGAFPNTGYTLNNPDASTTWAQTNVGRNSTKSIYMNHFDYSANGEKDELVLPFADLTQYNGAASLTFDVAYRYYSTIVNSTTCSSGGQQYACTWDTLKVLISTDCGTSWTTLYTKYADILATVAGATTSEFTPTNTQWRNETIDLTPYVGNNKALIKFTAINNYENNMYLDNINIISTSTVGINNFDNKKLNLNLFPNPANETVHIYFENLANESINIQFINAQGQHVKTMMLQSKVGANREDLYISDLQTGVYFVKINTSLGIGIKKLIVE
jgi:hypothetical protein